MNSNESSELNTREQLLETYVDTRTHLVNNHLLFTIVVTGVITVYITMGVISFVWNNFPTMPLYVGAVVGIIVGLTTGASISRWGRLISQRIFATLKAQEEFLTTN